MITLVARHGDRSVTVQTEPGATLHAALEGTDLKVRTGCTGNGSCGLCRVRIRSGAVTPPTSEERLHLDPRSLDAGVRLACQTSALDGVQLDVEQIAPRAVWTELTAEALASPRPRPAAIPAAPGPRIALDVGTSNLNLTVWNAAGTRRIAARRAGNPQGFGADVVTRMQAARDPEVAGQLAWAVRQAVAAALRDLPADGAEAVVLAVGNTVMLSLLRGGPAALLDPEAWTRPAPWPETVLRWDLGGRSASVTLVEPLGGFVGSDLLAAVFAAGLTQADGPALLVDFGTNTEIALWDGARLWVTSAAGGPAFEASGLRCAIPAEPGAIHRVRPDLAFEVLGGAAPKGVCGSGLVDWIACLLGSGQLSRRGTFRDPDPPCLGEAGGGIVLAKRDVDLFQRAKAAIGAGIQVVLGRAGLGCADLTRVVTTGLFGKALDVANAQAIGLLPPGPADRVETFDNLALAGCEALLAAPGGPRALDPLRERAGIINLATCAEFEPLFVQGLFIAPLEDR